MKKSKRLRMLNEYGCGLAFVFNPSDDGQKIHRLNTSLTLRPLLEEGKIDCVVLGFNLVDNPIILDWLKHSCELFFNKDFIVFRNGMDYSIAVSDNLYRQIGGIIPKQIRKTNSVIVGKNDNDQECTYLINIQHFEFGDIELDSVLYKKIDEFIEMLFKIRGRC